MAADLTTDSPLSRRIVRSFLDFLDSVKPAAGVDIEGLEVARECLTEVFQLHRAPTGDRNKNELASIFRSLEAREEQEVILDKNHEQFNIPSTSTRQNADESPETATPSGEDWIRKSHMLGLSKDELFGQFFAALEKIHFFKTAPDGGDDQEQLDRATRTFHDALTEMERSGIEKFDQNNLADALKTLGNRAMQSGDHSGAIDLYNIAIGLCENNAVYYCNRAAAYTQIHGYKQAIKDCQKSLGINPHYTKAYSRLGFAHYALGNYQDAISEGFAKALQLDPSNDAAKESLQMAVQKLNEQQRQTERGQNSGSQPARSRTGATPPSFRTMAFDATYLPGGLGSVAGNGHQGSSHPPNQPADGAGANHFEGPGLRLDGNIDLNFGDQMPEELTGALRSVMGMFGGASSHGNPQSNVNGRSAPS